MSRKIDVLNELGLLQRKSQSQLLKVALSKPEEYYKLREDIETAVLQGITENVYAIFTNLLSKGIIVTSKDDTSGTQLTLDGKVWSPELPYSDVQAFSLEVAEIIESKCEEAIEVIIPRDKNQLALNKQRSILKARTGIE